MRSVVDTDAPRSGLPIPSLVEIVAAVEGPDAATFVSDQVEVHPLLLGCHERIPRAVVAQALDLVAAIRLLDHVPTAREYLAAQRSIGRRIVLDHGAVRTVAWPNGSPLRPGRAQVERFLEPLGFRCTAIYPLARLSMTGRAFTQADLPMHVGQWFVSELHPDSFSAAFQAATERVLRTATDPIAEDERGQALLDELTAEHSLTLDDAVRMVGLLAGCLRRLHDEPLLEDWELLRAESAEMAWIATEGTTFNHATDRVADVAAVAEAERTAGRPIKDSVEVSRSGRVRQTAHRAMLAPRRFRTREGGVVERDVPTSFFEFISRDALPSEPGTESALDLGFDASNAQGIFAMTGGAQPPG